MASVLSPKRLSLRFRADTEVVHSGHAARNEVDMDKHAV